MSEAVIFIIFGLALLIIVPLFMFISIKLTITPLNIYQRMNEIKEEAFKLNPESFLVGNIFINFNIALKKPKDISIGEIKELRTTYDKQHIYYYKWIGENELLLTKRYQPKSFLDRFNHNLDLLYKTYVIFRNDRAQIIGRLFPWGRYYQILLVIFCPVAILIGFIANFNLEQLFLSIVFGVPFTFYSYYIAMKEPKQNMIRVLQYISNEK